RRPKQSLSYWGSVAHLPNDTPKCARSSSLIPPGAHDPPAGARRTRTACPGQLPEGARRIWSRNATNLRAPLVTHRYINFAGTLFRHPRAAAPATSEKAVGYRINAFVGK